MRNIIILFTLLFVNTCFAQYPLFKQEHASLNGTVSEFIWQIHQDRNNHYWFATNHDGIVCYNFQDLKQFKAEDGIGGSAVRSILEDDEGNLWFGTSNGISKYDGIGFTHYPINEDKSTNEVWSIAMDPTGLIWIGTVNGVYTFDGKDFNIFTVPKPPIPDTEPMLSKDRVSSILIDSKGTFWFINDGYGITLYDGNKFTFLTKENGLTDNHVAEVFMDSKGMIWIGTFYGGISRFDGQQFRHFTQEGLVRGLEAYNFCEDRSGNIWFSAENQGVFRFDGQLFKQFTMNEGLATNTIQSIFTDHKGQVWFSTWEGLSMYNGRTITDASIQEPWSK